MRKIIIFAFCLITLQLKAQNTFPTTGNVGIATINPKDWLVVADGFSFHSGGHRVMGIGYSPGSGKSMHTGYIGEVRLDPTSGKLSLGVSLKSYVRDETIMGISTAITIDKNANVGIGTINPTQKLSVNGTIQAKEIVVNTGWSDFVFDDNYKLRSLTEVEQFVKTNKHLPEIPSAQQVDKNGVQLGDISSKLLMKIEELTLYIIQQQKEIEKQKSININLENQIKELQNK